MPAPSLGQSKAKTLFLLASMVGWLIVGASLIYLMPTAANWLRPSELTGTWMQTLARSGYDPMLAIGGGGAALLLTVAGNILWYRKVEGKRQGR